MVNLSRMRALIAYEQRLRFNRLKKLAKATKITTTITSATTTPISTRAGTRLPFLAT